MPRLAFISVAILTLLLQVPAYAAAGVPETTPLPPIPFVCLDSGVSVALDGDCGAIIRCTLEFVRGLLRSNFRPEPGLPEPPPFVCA